MESGTARLVLAIEPSHTETGRIKRDNKARQCGRVTEIIPLQVAGELCVALARIKLLAPLHAVCSLPVIQSLSNFAEDIQREEEEEAETIMVGEWETGRLAQRTMEMDAYMSETVSS